MYFRRAIDSLGETIDLLVNRKGNTKQSSIKGHKIIENCIKLDCPTIAVSSG